MEIDRTLEHLFDLAQQYGNVDMFQDGSDRTFSCYITFQTIRHAELKAKSGFKHPSPRAALEAAIGKAQEIVASIQAEARRLDAISGRR
jgi:hypothetical protein